MSAPIREPWLRQLHWEELVNLQVDLGFLRHRFIRTVNAKISSQGDEGLEALDQLARVDELLEAAGERLEQAKRVLFDFCCEHAPQPSASTHNQNKADRRSDGG